MNLRPFHAPSLVVGAIGVVVIGLSMSQVAPTNLSWGPPKKSIVNIFAREGVGLPPGGVLMPPGGSHLVYQVPPDRWLTVTGVAANGGGFWAEDLAGLRTEKGFVYNSSTTLSASPAGCGAEIGWTFRPGSQVVVAHPGGGVGTFTITWYALIGYETRE